MKYDRFPYYFRTTRRDVVDGFNNDVLASARISGQADAFVAQFGGEAMYTQGFDTRFVGISFPKGPKYYADLWRKSPGSPLWELRTKVTPKQEARLAEIRRRWDATWPADAASVRASGLLTALGIQGRPMEQELLFYKEHQNTGYMACSFILSDVEEITCSQFKAGLYGVPPMLVPVTEEEALAAGAAANE